MGDTILLRRGTAANLPALQEGEPGWCTDTETLYIGGSEGSVNGAVRVGGHEIDALTYLPNTFTQATIEAALDAIGTTDKVTLLLRPGTWVISTALAFPANVELKMANGAYFSGAAVTAGTITIAGNKEVYPEWFGLNTVPGTTPMQVAIQATVNAATNTPVRLLSSYHCDTAIALKEGSIIRGVNDRSQTITFDAVDGFVATSVSNVIIEDVSIRLLVRYPTSANTLSGIRLIGTTGAYDSMNHRIKNVFVDGFKYGMKVDYIWNTRIEDFSTEYCHTGIASNGLSVNNFVDHCTLIGEVANTGGVGIDFSGTVPSEGWTITNNIISRFDTAILAVAMSHVYLSGNVLDTFQVRGIYLKSTGSDACLNWRIVNNPSIATTTATATAGITIEGTDNSAQNLGHLVSGNLIRTYGLGAFVRGIDLSGSGTTKSTDIVTGNTISGATEYDILVHDLAIVTNNQCLSAITTNIGGGKIVANNVGTVYYERAVTRSTVGDLTQSYDEAEPTTGTWKAGDIVWKINPVETGAPGSQYTVLGWRRLTNGTAHTTNTDWVEMRVLSGN